MFSLRPSVSFTSLMGHSFPNSFNSRLSKCWPMYCSLSLSPRFQTSIPLGTPWCFDELLVATKFFVVSKDFPFFHSLLAAWTFSFIWDFFLDWYSSFLAQLWLVAPSSLVRSSWLFQSHQLIHYLIVFCHEKASRDDFVDWLFRQISIAILEICLLFELSKCYSLQYETYASPGCRIPDGCHDRICPLAIPISWLYSILFKLSCCFCVLISAP